MAPKVTMKLSLNVFVDSNDENNFRHILLLTNQKYQKFQSFVKLFQVFHQLIKNDQILSCIK